MSSPGRPKGDHRRAPSEGSSVRLWLLRHAQPLVAAGVCYGATDLQADVQDTLRAARAAAAVLPTGACLLASPLQRCERLAQSLCGLRPDLTCQSDPRLVEMNFGCWEGQCWDAIPQAAYDSWTADFGQHRFGGQESVSELMRRVASVWDETHRAGTDALWITHAGVIRAATLIAQGVRQLEQAAQWPLDAPVFGGYCVLEG